MSVFGAIITLKIAEDVLKQTKKLKKSKRHAL